MKSPGPGRGSRAPPRRAHRAGSPPRTPGRDPAHGPARSKETLPQASLRAWRSCLVPCPDRADFARAAHVVADEAARDALEGAARQSRAEALERRVAHVARPDREPVA